MLYVLCMVCVQLMPHTEPPAPNVVSCCYMHMLCVQVFEFHSMKWSLWDRWILEGDLTVQQVLDWFKVTCRKAYA